MSSENINQYTHFEYITISDQYLRAEILRKTRLSSIESQPKKVVVVVVVVVVVLFIIGQKT